MLARRHKLDDDSDITKCEPTQYCQLIGSLIYLTVTRPDLSCLVSLLSQFMQTPRDIHLDYAKQVLRYVSNTMKCRILYKKTMLIQLKGYTYADGLAEPSAD